MSRKVLIGVGALAGIAIVVAIGIKTEVFNGAPIERLFGGQKDVPTIMIVNQQMLSNQITVAFNDAQFAASINDGATEAKNGQSQAATSDAKTSGPKTPGAKTADTKTPDTKTPDTKMGEKTPASKAEDSHKQGANMAMVLSSLQDSFGEALGDAFQSSGRFNVVANPEVIDAMQANGRGATRDQAKGFAGVVDVIRGLKGGHKTSKNTQETAKGATVEQTAELRQHGLTQVARKVKADYILVVSMSLPTDQPLIEAARDGTPTVNFVAQPIINYEIYETRNGRKSFRRTEQLAKPLMEGVTYRDGRFSPAPISAYYKLTSRLVKAASQVVLGNVLQEVAPARITRTGDQIVINRGANDGVQLGAVYSVEREVGDAVVEGADAKGKGGLALERLRKPVGQIRIDRVQDRVAVASVASGGPFSRDDVVLFAPSNVGSKAVAAASPDGGVALGSRGLSQADLAKSGTVLRQASVAIDKITVNQQPSDALARSLGSALQQDRRITVLSRVDLDRVLAERQVNAQSQGDTSGSVVEGLRTAGYLIVGEFRSSTSRRNNTISAGGVSRVISTSSSTQMSGTLRALSTDGALVESVDVSVGGGSLDALADTAARALLLKLFPMKVVQVDAAQGVVRLNRGDDAGLRAGSHVRLYSLGERIVDPQTGTLLSEGARTYVGDIVLTDVEPGISTGRFAGAPFPVAVGYAAQLGAGPSAAPSPVAAAAGPAAPPRPGT